MDFIIELQNSNLMILISYILFTGHPEWKNGIIKIFNLYNEGELKFNKFKFYKLILYLKITNYSKIDIRLVKEVKNKVKDIIDMPEVSIEADLTILGFLD